MRKRFAVIVAVGLLVALAWPVQAAQILVVSDCQVPGVAGGDHEDDELVSWLQGLGHTVDTSGMGQQMRGTFDAGDQAAVDAADLIMVSRRTDSGQYNQPAQWNTIAKPLILMSGYLTRDSRWGWTSGGSGDATRTETDMDIEAGQGGHPFLNEVYPLTGPVTLFDWSPGTQSPKAVYLPNAGTADEGTLIGTFAGRPMLIEIPEGTDLGGNFGTLGGQRVFFSHWGYDDTGQDYRWDDFITADYEAVLENIIAHKLPEIIPEPLTMLGVFGGLVGLGGYVRRRRK